MKIITALTFICLVVLAITSASTVFGSSNLLRNLKSEDYIRNVTGGTIQGYGDSQYPSVGVWKNIPFGNAPRFQDPTPATPWSGVLNTTKYGPGCINKCDFPIPSVTCSKTISEDCLNLNIFSPDPSGSQGGLPVMFWIPGGRYQFGAGSCELYSSEYNVQKFNNVVVTINYRLGAFGGLVTENGISGNFNMKDQILALKWVRDNIAKFGGDPNKITIAGESAGAMSVSVLKASPAAKGLFRAAAMSSNPLGLPFQDVKTAQMLGKNFLKGVGCSGLSSAAAEVACLQTKNVDLLLNVSNSDKVFPWPSRIAVDVVPWTPVVDPSGDILPIQPLDAATSGMISNVPTLLGNNANDSVLFISGISEKPMSELEVDAVLVAYFGIENAVSIKKMYPKPSNPDARIFLSRVMTDYIFSCPNRYYAVNSQKNYGNDNYFYLFDHLPSFVQWMWKSGNPSYAICAESGGQICHSTDLPFAFAMNENEKAMNISGSPTWSPADVQTVDIQSSMWNNFVNSGSSPNFAGWTPVVENNYVRYNVQPPVSGIYKDYRNQYCDFFDKIGYSRRGW